ncbi:hypothetical protein DFJ74DRAFT_678723 [Hyaloraphidium curvatum]|nr:hypothetical protein DFJ74DRAFT_678723 [Hyaloraphidium curvatum]
MPGAVLITGGNGITGSYLVEYLLSPEGEKHFTKVIATSRRAPNPDWVKYDLPAGALGKRLVWVEADLLNESPDALAEKFTAAGGAEITHVLWGAYVYPPQGWGSKEETDANEKIFDSTMRAVVKCSKKFERVVLQLGAKWHIRDPPMIQPIRESDEPPNVPLCPFYNRQLTVAKKLGAEHGFTWTCTLPLAILGVTRQTAMTQATSLATYILIMKHREGPLIFPGSAGDWNSIQQASSADLLAKHNVWAALEPKCAGQILNDSDGDFFRWKYLFPKMLAYFGVPKEKILLEGEMEKHLSQKNDVHTIVTAKAVTEEIAKESWAKVMAEDPSVSPDGWKQGVESMWFVDAMFASPFSLVYSATKNQQLGWNGYKDTEESFYDIFERMGRDGMAPKNVPGRDAARAVFKW